MKKHEEFMPPNPARTPLPPNPPDPRADKLPPIEPLFPGTQTRTGPLGSGKSEPYPTGEKV